MLLDDAHGTHCTIDEGKVALLHRTCVDEVDGLTEGAFGTQGGHATAAILLGSADGATVETAAAGAGAATDGIMKVL